MLEQLAEKYYNQGYNCAESIVHAGNEAYQLGLSEHDMRMAAAFGAGLQVGDVCGVLAGAGCVLSCLYVETRAPFQNRPKYEGWLFFHSRLAPKASEIHFLLYKG